MNKQVITFLVLTLMGSLFSAPVRADGEATILDAADVFREIMAVPDEGIPEALLSKVHAIAIVPGVIKVGFVIGGRHGKGVLMRRGDDGHFGDPAFISLTSGSVGWQIGAQSTDIVLVFRSRRGISGITSGKFTLGADAGVAAGPVGRHAEAGTDLRLTSEIYSYSRSRGLFAGVSLEGSSLQVDEDTMTEYYGPDSNATQVLAGRGKATSPNAHSLRQMIDENAGR